MHCPPQNHCRRPRSCNMAWVPFLTMPNRHSATPFDEGEYGAAEWFLIAHLLHPPCYPLLCVIEHNSSEVSSSPILQQIEPHFKFSGWSDYPQELHPAHSWVVVYEYKPPLALGQLLDLSNVWAIRLNSLSRLSFLTWSISVLYHVPYHGSSNSFQSSTLCFALC